MNGPGKILSQKITKTEREFASDREAKEVETLENDRAK